MRIDKDTLVAAASLLVASVVLAGVVWTIHHIGYVAGGNYERAEPGGCWDKTSNLSDKLYERERTLEVRDIEVRELIRALETCRDRDELK